MELVAKPKYLSPSPPGATNLSTATTIPALLHVPFQQKLENAEEIGRVDCCRGDTSKDWQQAVNPFIQNYSVVITDLLFKHSESSVGAELSFAGFQLIEEGWDISRVAGQQANHVVFTC